MHTQTARIVTLPQNPASEAGSRPPALSSLFPADSPIYFPVEARTVSVNGADGLPHRSRGHQAIVRTDTDAVLGIHSRSYKVVPNEPLFRGFDEALQASDSRPQRSEDR